MAQQAISRGRPLVALVAILLAWIGARAGILEYEEFMLGGSAQAPLALIEPPQQEAEHAGAVASHDESADRGVQAANNGGYRPVPYVLATPRPAPGYSPWSGADASVNGTSVRQPPQHRAVPVSVAAGHQAMWIAALARMPLPAVIAHRASPRRKPEPFFQEQPGSPSVKRWSADGWMLLRQNGEARLATGAVPATYGASQLGAVVRYRLAKDSAHKPAAYLRATAAINGISEKEVAMGVSARPFPSVPLVAAVEGRASDRPGGTEFRPAAMILTEVQPIKLPYNTRAEFYGQAGYVGGDFATAFADGQVRIDKTVGKFGRGELRAGAGAWAGAQKGAARVDIGPTAAVRLIIGDRASARLTVDWRLRAAGNAEPGSGPAVTLSAGF